LQPEKISANVAATVGANVTPASLGLLGTSGPHYSYFQYLTPFLSNCLPKIRIITVLTIAMNDSSQMDEPALGWSAAVPVRGGTYRLSALDGEKGAIDFFGPGGQRNPLKSLDSAKEIQGKTSLFL
jgi:hypothetical protein